MRILVTGALGFLGSHLCNALTEKGHTVIGVDDLSDGAYSNHTGNWEWEKLDLSDGSAVHRFFNRAPFDVVHHYAADATEGRSQFTPSSCTKNNLLAYTNVLSNAIRRGVKRVVLASSMSVYGGHSIAPFREDLSRMPVDVYGVNKAAMERITEILSGVHGFEYVILRPHNIYGNHQSLFSPFRNVFGIWLNCLLKNRFFYIYGDGCQQRAFSHYSDILPCMVAAQELPAEKVHGQIVNIGAFRPYTLNEAARTLLEVFLEKEIGPGVYFEGCPEHLKPKYLPPRPVEVKHAFCTTKKSEDLLGFVDRVSLRDGLAEMVAWGRLQGPQEWRYVILEIENDKTPKTWANKLY